MLKTIKLLVLSCFLIVSVLSISGCFPLILGAAAGAGSVAYIRGNLEQNVDFSVAEVHNANLSALKDLKLFIKEDELNRHNAITKAEFEDGKKVRIDITALTERASKIKIRVGILGDESNSRLILNAILQNL